MDSRDETTWMKCYSLAGTTACGFGYGMILDDAHLEALSGVVAGRLEGVLAAIAFLISLPMSSLGRLTLALFAVFYGAVVIVLGGVFDILRPTFADWIFGRPLHVDFHYADLGRIAGPWVGVIVFILAAGRRTGVAGSKGLWATIAQDPTLAILASVCSILGFTVGTWSDVLSKF